MFYNSNSNYYESSSTECSWPGIVLGRVEKYMTLANYAENTIATYTQTLRLLGCSLGKSPENIEQDELVIKAKITVLLQGLHSAKD